MRAGSYDHVVVVGSCVNVKRLARDHNRTFMYETAYEEYYLQSENVSKIN